MVSKTFRSKSLSEALDDELLETIDEELELEFDDQRLDSVLGPHRAGGGQRRSARPPHLFPRIAAIAAGIDQIAGLGRSPETQIGRAVRGPRRCRQGRGHQAYHPAAQPA